MGGRWLSRATEWVVPLLGALLTSACLCGGQTGECFGGSSSAEGSAIVDPPCPTSTIEFDQVSHLGFSAEEMLVSLGDTKSTAVVSVDEGFWEQMAVAEPPSVPFDLVLTVEYAGSPVTDDSCQNTLSVEVIVGVDLGGGFIRREALGTLVGTPTQASLSTTFAAPLTADASPEALFVSVVLTPTTANGTLVPGLAQAATSPPRASFGVPAP
jgi:hypothetical protein